MYDTTSRQTETALIARVDVVHAVDTVLVAIFVVIFCNWRCTLYSAEHS